MIDDIKKSITSIFSERVSSPFYGTLAMSWLIWNWKIIYLTFIIDQNKIEGNKIDYIVTNYGSLNNLISLPLISTLILLTLIPFITNGAYWLDIKFTNWRVNAKNEIEGKQLLTVEQSIQLRMDIRELELNFDKLLEKKNEEIKFLKEELEKNRNNKKEDSKVDTLEGNKVSDLKLLADNIERKGLLSNFENIIELVDNKRSIEPSNEAIIYLLKIGLLEKGNYDTGGKYIYSFSSQGKEFRKYYIKNYLLK